MLVMCSFGNATLILTLGLSSFPVLEKLNLACFDLECVFYLPFLYLPCLIGAFHLHILPSDQQIVFPLSIRTVIHLPHGTEHTIQHGMIKSDYIITCLNEAEMKNDKRVKRTVEEAQNRHLEW